MSNDLDGLKKAVGELAKSVAQHRAEHGDAPLELDDTDAMLNLNGITEFIKGDDEQDGPSREELFGFLGWKGRDRNVRFADFLALCHDIEVMGLRQLNAKQSELFCDAVLRLSKHFAAAET